MGAESALVRHHFTREEYDRLLESGALAELRVELLNGEIVDVSPQGPLHVAGIRALTAWFAARGDLLAVQLPYDATYDSKPEPDVALEELDGTALLVVEVVVTARAAARRKTAIYAQAGVPEHWIVDMPRREVIVHREPGPDGYASVERRTTTDTLTPPAGVPAKTVDELFALAARYGPATGTG